MTFFILSLIAMFFALLSLTFAICFNYGGFVIIGWLFVGIQIVCLVMIIKEFTKEKDGEKHE